VSRARGPVPTCLLLTCEHAGNRIPKPYAPLFAGAGEAVASHRGWDPGALKLARFLSRRLRRPLLATHWSRLLVEANRSAHNPRIWSQYTRGLPRAERERILERYWRPHRQQVIDAVDGALARGERVLHVAVHSFTAVLDGEERNCDVSFLYDSARHPEAAIWRRWAALLRQHRPEVRVRLNYPYLGVADGLPTWLRRHYPADRYTGTEMEVNQGLIGTPAGRSTCEALAASLAELVAEDPYGRSGVAGARKAARRAGPARSRGG
jgi:predicted N-formylglutamate amidohydrolase